MGQGQQRGHHLVGAHSMLCLHLAAWSQHTDGSTAPSYQTDCRGEHLQGTMSKVPLKIRQASKLRDIFQIRPGREQEAPAGRRSLSFCLRQAQRTEQTR